MTRGWGLSFTVFTGLLLALIIGIIVFPFNDSTTLAARRECDRQIAVLMSTKDMVELDRAKFLITWFNCSVARRLQE